MGRVTGYYPVRVLWIQPTTFSAASEAFTPKGWSFGIRMHGGVADMGGANRRRGGGKRALA